MGFIGILSLTFSFTGGTYSGGLNVGVCCTKGCVGITTGSGMVYYSGIARKLV